MNEVSIFDAFLGRISQFFTEFFLARYQRGISKFISTFAQNYENILKPALNETIYMSLMAVFFGFILAIIPEFYLLFGIKMVSSIIKSLMRF